MSDLMPHELDRLRHALGVHAEARGGTYRFRRPYRNRYLASPEQAEVWESLVARGYAIECSPVGWDPKESPYRHFKVTEAGKTIALEGIVYKRKWGHIG